MSDEDLIRRGDAIAALEAAISAYHDDDTVYTADRIDDFPDALRTIPAAQPSPDVAALVDALEGVMTHEPDHSDTLWQNARAALARLKGGAA